jgi:vacuolar protein sorting-associated protein 16
MASSSSLSSSASSASDWKQLHDRYYRKNEIYALEWNVDLSKYKVVGAPFGGPVAVTRDETKIQLVSKDTIKPAIQIYTSTGQLISTFFWDRGRIIEMGWTTQEQLVCVISDGTVCVLSLYPSLFLPFSLFH